MTDHEENGGFYDDAGGQTVPFHKDHSNGSRYYDRESLESRGRSHKDYDYGSENQRKDERVRTERSDRDSHGRSHRSRHHERGHDRNRHGYEHERDRIRDRNRERDQERDREQRHTHRSHSRSKESSRRHSRSRSRSHERRSLKRQSGFDMAPPAAALPNSLLPGAGLPPTVPAVLPGMFPFPAATQFGGLAAMSMQSMTQQATRHARRVYVGGLPPLANEQTIATFFSQVMAAIGGNTAGAGDAVVNVYINHEKKFAFVEMRTVEEASNAMALDGIIFEGVSVRVRRPTDYNPSVAATLGPSQPSPHLNLAAVGLTPGAIGGADGPDRVFVGGLPYYLTEAQIRELLESFGSLRGFDLVKDQDTGNSKGYGFCVYQDPAVTDVACAALNGLKMGDKTLTVRRATASGQPKPDQFGAFTQASLALGAAGGLTGFGSLTPTLPTGVVPGMVPSLAGGVTSMFETPTKVICLSQVVNKDELQEDDAYEEIFDDMKDECSKYGNLLNLVIPRPSSEIDDASGVGKVFLEYSDVKEAAKAKEMLHGRKFGGNTVQAVFFSEENFSKGKYDS